MSDEVLEQGIEAIGELMAGLAAVYGADYVALALHDHYPELSWVMAKEILEYGDEPKKFQS